MVVVVLDVDGVLLDPDRAGAGHWSNVLTTRFGITRAALREAFFEPAWDAVVTGRRAIEPALAEALVAIGSPVAVEDVLSCWFETDFVPIDLAIEFATRVVATGVPVALATNQEHRRVEFLRVHLAPLIGSDSLLYSAEIGVQKHDPTFFDRVSQRLGVSADRRAEVLFIDDTMRNVAQARHCGWTALHADTELAWIGLAQRALAKTP